MKIEGQKAASQALSLDCHCVLSDGLSLDLMKELSEVRTEVVRSRINKAYPRIVNPVISESG